MLGFNDFMDLLDPFEQHRFHQAFEKIRSKTVDEVGYDRFVFPELKDYLLAAFPWGDTDQGFDYWEAIHNRVVDATSIELYFNLN